MVKKLKLYFLLIFDGDVESGVNKKIFSQVKTLNEMGIDANLILIGDTSKIKLAVPYIIKEPITNIESKSLITRLYKSRKIANIIGDRIRNIDASDILYIRYPIFIAFCPIVFFKPFRKCKLIFEFNSLTSKEYLLMHEYFYLFFELFFGMFIRYQADGGIGVTNEITNYQRKKIGSRNTSFVTIANGIDVDSIHLRAPPDSMNDFNFTMICVASFSPWHGLDRLIHGIAQYKGKYFIKLHIVGEGSEINNLKNLCEKKAIINHVIFHGFLSGATLDKLFDVSHIAIGILGTRRQNLSEASPLKNREYCSRGIPFISDVRDPDFSSDFPYCLYITPDESIIDVERIISFAKSLYENSYGHQIQMRNYAKQRLDWSQKIGKLKYFLENDLKR